MSRIWIETTDGEKKQITAGNWTAWKSRGAKRCKPPKAERAVRDPSGEQATTDEYPKHVGGGWYELADGSKVRKADLEE